MSETKRDTGKGDYKMSGVKLTDIVEKMNLKNLTPEVDITEREVLVPDVNRPASESCTDYRECRVCLSGDFGRREKS